MSIPVPLLADVVVKPRKIINVGGRELGARDEFVLDVMTQSVHDIRYLLRAIAYNTAQYEIDKGNTPSRLAVDNREDRDPEYARRKIEVTFGDHVDKFMIKAVERGVSNMIRRETRAIEFMQKLGTQSKFFEAMGAAAFSKADLTSRSNWQWVYVAEPRSKGVKVNINKLKVMPKGARLIYRPTSKFAGLVNMFSTRFNAGWTEGEMFKKGRASGQGFMSRSINSIKRAMPFKNYVMNAGFTAAYRTNQDVWKPGKSGLQFMPYITIRAARKGKTGRAYAKISKRPRK